MVRHEILEEIETPLSNKLRISELELEVKSLKEEIEELKSRIKEIEVLANG